MPCRIARPKERFQKITYALAFHLISRCKSWHSHGLSPVVNVGWSLDLSHDHATDQPPHKWFPVKILGAVRKTHVLAQAAKRLFERLQRETTRGRSNPRNAPILEQAEKRKRARIGLEVSQTREALNSASCLLMLVVGVPPIINWHRRLSCLQQRVRVFTG